MNRIVTLTGTKNEHDPYENTKHYDFHEVGFERELTKKKERFSNKNMMSDTTYSNLILREASPQEIETFITKLENGLNQTKRELEDCKRRLESLPKAIEKQETALADAKEQLKEEGELSFYVSASQHIRFEEASMTAFIEKYGNENTKPIRELIEKFNADTYTARSNYLDSVMENMKTKMRHLKQTAQA